MEIFDFQSLNGVSLQRRVVGKKNHIHPKNTNLVQSWDYLPIIRISIFKKLDLEKFQQILSNWYV